MLRRSRTGKKAAITKRIGRLMGMVEAGACSRRQIRMLMEKLVAVFEELEKVCTEISDLSIVSGVAEDELNDLEDVRMNLDECVVQVEDHLESRQDEAPSSSSDSLTRSWLYQNSEIMDNASARDAEELSLLSECRGGTQNTGNEIKFASFPAPDGGFVAPELMGKNLIGFPAAPTEEVVGVDESITSLDVPAGYKSERENFISSSGTENYDGTEHSRNPFSSQSHDAFCTKNSEISTEVSRVSSVVVPGLHESWENTSERLPVVMEENTSDVYNDEMGWGQDGSAGMPDTRNKRLGDQREQQRRMEELYQKASNIGISKPSDFPAISTQTQNMPFYSISGNGASGDFAGSEKVLVDDVMGCVENNGADLHVNGNPQEGNIWDGFVDTNGVMNQWREGRTAQTLRTEVTESGIITSTLIYPPNCPLSYPVNVTCVSSHLSNVSPVIGASNVSASTTYVHNHITNPLSLNSRDYWARTMGNSSISPRMSITVSNAHTPNMTNHDIISANSAFSVRRSGLQSSANASASAFFDSISAVQSHSGVENGEIWNRRNQNGGDSVYAPQDKGVLGDEFQRGRLPAEAGCATSVDTSQGGGVSSKASQRGDQQKQEHLLREQQKQEYLLREQQKQQYLLKDQQKQQCLRE